MIKDTVKEICGLLLQLIRLGQYDELLRALEEMQEIEDEALDGIREIMEIYRMESESATGTHSAWFDARGWEQIQADYGKLCALLLDLAEGRRDAAETLGEEIASGRVSHDAVRRAMCGLTLQGKELGGLWDLPKKPLVSVIVCVYNGEAFVRDTLDSVLGQTYDNMEILVIDDASMDGSRSVIEEYARRDARIVPVFLEKNRNVCNAGNAGFERATGKYVALIGHDDMWRRDKIEKQVSFLEEHPTYSVCFSWADIVDENGESLNKRNGLLRGPFCCENYSGKEWSRRLFFQNNEFCAPSACIRRDALKRTGGYRYALVQLQDYDLWLRLLGEGNVYVLQERLTLYRRFTEKGRHISVATIETDTRGWHEMQWIRFNYIDKMPDETFRHIFEKNLKRPELRVREATVCEKAFLLWRVKNCFAVKLFVELFEEEKTRKLLEENFEFGLQDFYRMNTQPMPFDRGTGGS